MSRSPHLYSIQPLPSGSSLALIGPGRVRRPLAQQSSRYARDVEIELSALSRQCLQRRIGTQEALEQEVRAWVAERNRRRVTVRWQFTVQDARQKFAKRYLV